MDTEALTERLLASTLGMVDMLTVCLGHQLGLYRALHEQGSLTPSELAEHAGIAPRYAEEWLQQQAVSGLLHHDGGRYALPADHVPVLLDRDSLTYMTPLADLMAAAGAQIENLLQAYRSGSGVSWSAYGRLMREGQAAGNRPWFLGPLVDDWLPSIDGLADRLADGGRVLEIGCGEGWAAIAIAQRWPAVHVDAIDIDQASIDAARDHTAATGLHDRLVFHTDPATVPAGHDYDLVLALECLHDMPDPVTVLRAMREHVAPDGVVLVMDERTTDAFTGEGDELEQLLYGWSVLICLPDSLSHPGSVGTGTVMRPDTLREYATQAGFAAVDVLPIEHDLWRFYRIT